MSDSQGELNHEERNLALLLETIHFIYSSTCENARFLSSRFNSLREFDIFEQKGVNEVNDSD